MSVDFEDVFGTLCREQNDPVVVRVLERLGMGTRRVVQHLVYMDYFDQGVSFLFNQRLRVSTIFFFSEGRHRHHREYTGSFPCNLRFGVERDVVRSNFNQLMESGEGGGEMFGIPVEPWDKFAYKGHVLHVEYAGEDLTVEMVTVSCGEGQVESPPVEGVNTGGLMSLLRRWFKRKHVTTKQG